MVYNREKMENVHTGHSGPDKKQSPEKLELVMRDLELQSSIISNMRTRFLSPGLCLLIASTPMLKMGLT